MASDRTVPRFVLIVGLAVVVILLFIVILWFQLESESATLADAVESSDESLAVRLLDGGANPDEPRSLGFTPLMRAVIRDDADMVRLLIDAGADLELTAPEGLRLVHLAAQADASRTLAILLEKGLDPEVRSVNGMSSIDHAAATGGVEAIGILVAAGVDPDRRSDVTSQGHGYPRVRGPTPLMIAAGAGQLEAVDALLRAGASVSALSDSGHDALLVAVWTDQDPRLIAELIDAGARPDLVASCDEACSAPPGDALDWAHELGRQEIIPILESVESGRGSRSIQQPERTCPESMCRVT